MKPLFGGSAIAAAALLSALPLVAARPSVAETAVQPQQSLQQPTTAKNQVPGDSAGKVLPETPAGKIVEPLPAETAVLPPVSYIATAYSLRGRTARAQHALKHCAQLRGHAF